jgi:tetratricopeptide (TPR) repeat protein
MAAQLKQAPKRQRARGEHGTRASSRERSTSLWLGSILFVATIIAYIPALKGGFIWDDPDYVTNNHALRSAEGLWDIWTNPRSIPQWYPLVHTSYWIEYHLWGLNPFGYHLVNVLLHAGGALLLWKLLKKLNVPGAWLAAAVFALHPIHVESVAWVTERKNTLSAFLYFGAALAYLRTIFAEPLKDDSALAGSLATRETSIILGRDWMWYAIAFVLFAGAMFSKTVSCSFPAAVLLMIWWKRGRLRLRDVYPLIPFFILGIALAMETSHLEKTRVGASGPEWTYAPTLVGELVFRTLVAGRAIWFYAWTNLCPINLAFIYSRWHIAIASWWQYLFPISVALVVFSLYFLRRKIGRAPLVAILFFIGTLFPALGYFNVYPMRFSWVADHFQHLASVGFTTLFAAIIWRFMPSERARWIVSAVILLPLAILTFRQTTVYEDPVTLWQDTLRKSPNSWMVYTNLGNALVQEGKIDEAIPYHEQALKLAPNLHDTHWNVGEGLMRRADREPDPAKRDAMIDAAEAQFKRAMEINPNGFAPAYDSLGKIEMSYRHNLEAAEKYFKRAVEIAPQWDEANYDYGRLLEKMGRIDEAIDHYRTAVAYKPDYADAHEHLGILLAQQGQLNEATWNFHELVRLEPDNPQAHVYLAAVLMKRQMTGEAIAELHAALRLAPNHPLARQLLHQLTGE